MGTRQDYMKILGAVLHPNLRAAGFRGSGETLRRQSGDVIHVFNIQDASGAERCYMNLGIHLSFLPEVGSTSQGGCNPKAIKEHECILRLRVNPPPEFQFGFPYGATAAETQRSVEKLAEAWQREGPPFFRQLSSFPEDFLRITPEAVRAGSSPLGALYCARIALHLGDVPRAKEFAQVGYDQVVAKSGPRDALYFTRMLNNPNRPAYWTGWCPAPEWEKGAAGSA